MYMTGYIANLKKTCPLMLQRKIRATVPVSGAGVPFMPKTARSVETQNLFIVSKHKWILEGTIETTGAPYTDTFKIQLRTVAESNENGSLCVI